jgi:hypothetical protein
MHQVVQTPNQPLSGIPGLSAIIHWTIRCATGLSVSQRSNGSLRQWLTLQSATVMNSDAQKSEHQSQRGTGLSGATRGQSLQRSTSSEP